MEDWRGGVVRVKNRVYQKLRVWQDAIEFYMTNCRVLECFSSNFDVWAPKPLLRRTPFTAMLRKAIADVHFANTCSF